MAVTAHPQRLKWSRDEVRERIVSDFRDFRFTWGGFLKWTGITLLAVLFAAIVTLYFLDWNQMRGPLGRYLSHRTGREVRIDGNLSVKLQAWQLPPIRRFLVNNGHVRIEDAVRKLHFTGTVTSEENSGRGSSSNGKSAAFTLTGDGTLNKSKFLADVKGGPLLNVDQTRPYDFTADVRAGETHAAINGTITQPFHMDRFTAGINISGPNLADLYFM